MPHSFDLGIAATYSIMRKYWKGELKKRHLSTAERRIFRAERVRLSTLSREAKAQAEYSDGIAMWARDVETMSRPYAFPQELESCGEESWDAESLHSFYLGQEATIGEMVRHWENASEGEHVANSERAICKREAMRLRDLNLTLEDEVAKARVKVAEALEKEREVLKDLRGNPRDGYRTSSLVSLTSVRRLIQALEDEYATANEVEDEEIDEDATIQHADDEYRDDSNWGSEGGEDWDAWRDWPESVL